MEFCSFSFVLIRFCSFFVRFGFVFFFVFLVGCHCKSLSYPVLQVVRSFENWVRFAYKGYRYKGGGVRS